MAMTRQELEKRISRKEQEVHDLERQIHDAKIYIGALQDILRLLPKDGAEVAAGSVLRPGSSLAKAQEAIRQAGRPLHVADLLKAMGLPNDRKSRGGLSGTLSPYVRRGEVFTRPGPNVFGLKELEAGQSGSDADDEPPESFGSDNSASTSDS